VSDTVKKKTTFFYFFFHNIKIFFYFFFAYAFSFFQRISRMRIPTVKEFIRQAELYEISVETNFWYPVYHVDYIFYTYRTFYTHSTVSSVGFFKDIYIYYVFDDSIDQSSTLKPPSDFGGSVRIHVTRNSIYLTHYDWNDLSGGFEFVSDIEPVIANEE